MKNCGLAIGLAERPHWDEALSRVPHAFGHTWDSCNAMAATSGHPTFLFHYRSSSAEYVCPYSVRSFEGRDDIYTPYGFSGFTGVGDAAEVLAAWREFVERERFVCGYIALHPLLADPRFLSLPECRSDNEMFVLDLSRGEEALLAAMSRGRRGQLRRWVKEGPPVLDDQRALAAHFTRNVVAFLQSRGASRTYDFSARTLQLLVESPATFLLGFGRPDAIEMSALFARGGAICEHLLMATTPGYESHYVPLTWAGALRLMESGVRWLSMGGGIAPGDGVALAKQRFGGLRLPQPVLRQIYDPATFDRLTATTDQPETGYFPPYRQGL